jgi:hypothetical protein
MSCLGGFAEGSPLVHPWGACVPGIDSSHFASFQIALSRGTEGERAGSRSDPVCEAMERRCRGVVVQSICVEVTENDRVLATVLFWAARGEALIGGVGR